MKLYALRNSEGKYFKNRGRGSFKPRWINNLEQARLYDKPHIANAQATRWESMCPKYGRPEIVELDVVNLEEVHVLKKLPWQCVCGKFICTITYQPNTDNFMFKCPKCGEEFYT